MTFTQWWDNLPLAMKRGDRNRAKSRYDAIVKAGQGDSLKSALNAYLVDQGANSWRGWLYAASFLGRWQQWAPSEPQNRESYELFGSESVPEKQIQELECDYCLVMVPAGEIQIIHGLKACPRDAKLWESSKMGA